VKAINVLHAEKTVARSAVRQDEREHDAGELWVKVVEHGVGGEVNDGVVAPVSCADAIAVGVEVERLPEVVLSYKAAYGDGFQAGVGQAFEVIAGDT
jgi:hypothetical protein